MKKNKSSKSKDEEESKQDTSIRKQYVDLGVKTYYEEHGSEYKNPHEQRVKSLIQEIVKNWNLDTTKVLDLACGSGEVTLALKEIDVKDIEGIDPYTHEAYEKRTKLKCLPLSFEDISSGKLYESKFSLIICSYAMHLASNELLPVLAMQLALISKQLVIITPHKRPEIETKWGWELINEVVKDRTRARLYFSTMYTAE